MRLRQTVADYARRLHARGWVANHDGNITARLGDDRTLATPTATSKAEVTQERLLVVDAGGARISGSGKPFSEIGMHLTIYRSRPDVGAVVHAHPPAATAFACVGRALDRPFLAEAVVSLGPSVPLVPCAAPGNAACAAIAAYAPAYDAVLVANHGVFAWGADVEQAYLRLELVEHLANIAARAEALGGLRPLPDGALAALLEARRKAGLGMAASAAATPAPSSTGNSSDKKAVVACAPPPPGSDVVLAERPRAATLAGMPPDVVDIIKQEIAAALKNA